MISKKNPTEINFHGHHDDGLNTYQIHDVLSYTLVQLYYPSTFGKPNSSKLTAFLEVRKIMSKKILLKRFLISFVFAALMASATFAQGTGFNFQGRLNDGTSPANGRYDLQFRLFDALVGGNPIGSLVSRPNTVLVNGVFSVTLDFGAAAFNNPNSIFIEIGIRPNGSSNAFTILGPRQQLTAVPFAVRAANATDADNATNAQNSVNAQNAVNATNAANATNALSLGGVAAAGWVRLNVQNTGDLLITGKLQITGNATQSNTSNGLVKAMLIIRTGTVDRCYNGITNSSTGNCGFTVTQPVAGVFRIDFGFPVSDRFVSVSAQYCDGCFGGSTNNIGANYRIFNSTSYEVFTFQFGSADTTPRDFTLILY